MPRLVRALAAVLTAAPLACSLGVAAPALADSQSHHDPRGDVTRLMGRAAALDGRLDDVVGLRNTYDGARLRVSMTALELPRAGWTAFWKVRTAEDYFTLALYKTSKGPRVVLVRERTYPGSRGAVPPTDCRAAKGAVRGETVHASVPRRCLRFPDVVEVSGVIQDDQRSRFDDSRQRRYDGSAGPDVFGPPLRHN